MQFLVQGTFRRVKITCHFEASKGEDTCARSSARQGSSVVAAIVGAITVDVAVAAGVLLFSLGTIHFSWKALSFRLKSLRKLLVFIRNDLISFGQH